MAKVLQVGKIVTSLSSRLQSDDEFDVPGPSTGAVRKKRKELNTYACTYCDDVFFIVLTIWMWVWCAVSMSHQPPPPHFL